MIRQVVCLAGLATLMGCGGPPAPAPSFPPLDYSYLPPITLAVGNISVANDYVPDSGAATLLAQDPEPPANAMLDVLNHRLLASGSPGSATATIETASIDQEGGNLVGVLTVAVNVTSPDGRRTGYTEASVTQTDTAPDPDSSQTDVQEALYTMTKQMMDAINVQLQYQIEQNLPGWVVTGGGVSGAAAASGSGEIQATPLTTPTAIPAGPNGAAPTMIPPGPPTPLTLPGSPPAMTPPPPPQLVPSTPPPLPIPTAPTPAAPTPTTPAAPAAPFNPANVGL